MKISNILKNKSFFAIASLLSLSAFSFALETGGLFTNNTKFHNVEKDGDLKLNQKNGISLWLKAPLSEDGTSYFVTEGSFKTEYDASVEESDDKLILSADIDLFKLVLRKETENGSLLFSAGRFYFSDLSTLVLAQNADGVQLDFSSSIFSTSVYAGYTGLLNEKNITILDSEAAEAVDSKTLYSFSKKYALAALKLSASNFAASQSVSLEGLGAFRLEDGDKFNRFYGTLSLSGPVAPTLSIYYALSSTLGFVQAEDDTYKGNLSQCSLSWYPDFKSSSLSLSALYASGSQGPFDGFMGFTSQTAVDSVLEPEYSGILKGGLSASIKPISNLLLSAKANMIFSAAAGDEEKDIEFAGLQYSLGGNWQVVSDFSLGASFCQYISSNDDFSGTIGDTRTQLKISASLAF